MMIKSFYKNFSVMTMISLVVLNSKNYKSLYWEFDLNPTENILALLSIMIFLMMFMTLFMSSKKDNNLMNYSMFSVILCCVLAFISSNKFIFFLMFEISMIPMFISILSISKDKSKVYSAIVMMIMNMAMAIPCVIYIFKEYFSIKTLNLYTSSLICLKNLNFIMGIMMILMMLSKAPMFFIHIWLPKAHVDSFTMGSVVLASLMIKLSIMGLIKLNIMLEEKLNSFSSMIFSVSWTTLIISLMMMMRSVDIKKLAATSSIVHMGTALNSVLSMKFMGVIGSVMVLFSHGLISAMMFAMIGLMYETSEGRSAYSNKSNESFNKTMAMIWTVILFLNVGIPPTMSFFSEVFLMSTFIFMNKSSVIFLAMSMILISNASMMSMVKVIFKKKEKSLMILKENSCMFMNIILSFIIMNIMIMKIY